MGDSRRFVLAGVAATTVTVVACTLHQTNDLPTGPTSGGSAPAPTGNGTPALTAQATLQAVDQSTTSGTGAFNEGNGAVTFTFNVQNAAPGKHGLHVHQGGDCTAPGPHYGPDGGPYHGEYSVDVGTDGTGRLNLAATDVTVSQGTFSVVGHALVFHGLPPGDGGAAPRAACGVLR